MGGLILLAIVGVVAYRLITAEQRAQYFAYGLDVARALHAVATQPRPEADVFRERLRARMPFLAVTPAIAALNLAVMAGMLFGPAASVPETLIRWGASVGPLTTNGEWWRLLTAAFVHTSVLQLLVNVAVLCQLGAVLERLAGRLTFVAVYVSAGVIAGLISLSLYPVAVNVAATAATFGLYGLLIALLMWQMFQRHREDPQTEADPEADPNPEAIASTRITMPLIVMKRLGIGATFFILYNMVNGEIGAAELGALSAGLGYGLVLGWCVSERHVRTGPLVATIATSAIIAVAWALPLRNIADVKPEIARTIATEESTSAAYHAALRAYQKGNLTADALAELAERRILPEVQAVGARLDALRHVPPEHQAIVDSAREFVRLRCQSWRLRAVAIRRADAVLRRAKEGTADARWRLDAEARFRSNMVATGNAEGAERASLEIFERLKRDANAGVRSGS
jgi:membrane associated rhomboid family serine protease